MICRLRRGQKWLCPRMACRACVVVRPWHLLCLAHAPPGRLFGRRHRRSGQQQSSQARAYRASLSRCHHTVTRRVARDAWTRDFWRRARCPRYPSGCWERMARSGMTGSSGRVLQKRHTGPQIRATVCRPFSRATKPGHVRAVRPAPQFLHTRRLVVVGPCLANLRPW